MAKKKENEIRVICVSREAFFAIIEAFIYDKIRGTEPPEGSPVIIPDDERGVLWTNARYVSGGTTNIDEEEIILNYQNDTISRLHQLGYSYRVLDRKGDEIDGQLSLFDSQNEEGFAEFLTEQDREEVQR